jgi:hypothetical protein
VKKRAAAAAAKVAYRPAEGPAAVALSDDELVAMFNTAATTQGKKTKGKHSSQK